MWFTAVQSSVEITQCLYVSLLSVGGGGGCSPKKTQKIPVATPKSVNWDWVFLEFFGFFWVF